MSALRGAAQNWVATGRALLARRPVRWLFEILLIVFAVFAINAFQTRNVHVASLASIRLPTLDGAVVDGTSLRGKPTMLVVWAPWCGVCAAESQNVSWIRSLVGERAHVASLASHYRAIEEVHAFTREHGVDYPVLLGGRDGARSLGVNSFPTLLFFDSEGQFTRAATGYTTTLGMLVRILLS